MQATITNIIVIGILVVILFFAVKNTIPHFKGEGSCCGGGGRPKRNRPAKIGTVVSVKTVKINGMSCEHCYARVQNALNSLEGVNAKVNGSRDVAVIKADREISDERIEEVIAELGYAVASIETK
ncbi:MAG: cation transporter [Lachnospiraceae bacterium]|nr:cation transporter [Lachnospiraceae bacterium]